MNIEDLITTDLDLDQVWLKNYKEAEKEYADFYPEPVLSVTGVFLYIDPVTAEIVFMKKEILLLSEPNLVKHDQIISLIKPHYPKYKIVSLLRYNIDLEPDEIQEFIRGHPVNPDLEGPASELTDCCAGGCGDPRISPATPVTAQSGLTACCAGGCPRKESSCEYAARFMTNMKSLGDLVYKPTISIFQDLNTLYFIFASQGGGGGNSMRSGQGGGQGSGQGGGQGGGSRKFRLDYSLLTSSSTRRRHHKKINKLKD
jgi:uncharacterized membrane protein YgcG